jgi:hypothetical protein
MDFTKRHERLLHRQLADRKIRILIMLKSGHEKPRALLFLPSTQNPVP